MTMVLELPPHHLIHHPHIALDDADDFRGDVFVHIVGDGDAGQAVADQGDRHIHALQQSDSVDAAKHEAAFVKSLRALGRGADAHGRERMPDRRKETRFLRQRPRIRHNREGIHLQTIIIMEPQRLMLDHAAVQHKPGSLQALARTRMAAIQDRHVILLRHRIDRIKQRQEILLRINILLAVRRQQDVAPLLQPQPRVDVGRLDLREVRAQHLRHRAARHVRALLRQAAIGQIATRVLGIRHIHVGNDVHDAAVRLLRQALVLAAVARFHVENGNMQALRANDRQKRMSL